MSPPHLNSSGSYTKIKINHTDLQQRLVDQLSKEHEMLSGRNRVDLSDIGQLGGNSSLDAHDLSSGGLSNIIKGFSPTGDVQL